MHIDEGDVGLTLFVWAALSTKEHGRLVTDAEMDGLLRAGLKGWYVCRHRAPFPPHSLR